MQPSRLNRCLYLAWVLQLWSFSLFLGLDILSIQNCIHAFSVLLLCTVPKILCMYSQKWNCAVSFPIPTFMYLWAIYIFPGSVCLFGCSKIAHRSWEYKSLTDTWMWKLGDRTVIILFWKYWDQAAHFHFWKYINWNQPSYWILTSSSLAVCLDLSYCSYKGFI